MKNITIPLGQKIIFETEDPKQSYFQEGFSGGLIFGKEVQVSDDTVKETITQPDMTTYELITQTIISKRQVGTSFTDFTI